ncbi:MAG: hypothetical protein M1818_004947 [Claussenomyces sp. TS43310]|nr:MAG: hypothetical protein M1818_004947 [Claussenomyces sp. TS43310]
MVIWCEKPRTFAFNPVHNYATDWLSPFYTFNLVLARLAIYFFRFGNSEQSFAQPPSLKADISRESQPRTLSLPGEEALGSVAHTIPLNCRPAAAFHDNLEIGPTVFAFRSSRARNQHPFDSQDLPRPPFTLSPSNPNHFNDLYDVYELSTPVSEQRQQDLPSAQHSVPCNKASQASTTSSARTLRRTGNFEQPASTQQAKERTRNTHIEAASVGIPSPPVPHIQFGGNGERALTNDLSSSLGGSSISGRPSSLRRRDTRIAKSRPSRISKHTASAILYTLEIALRHPNPFTPDLLEENASMSELRGSSSLQPSRGGNGNGASSSRGQGGGAPAPTGSPAIKGPRDIMRERQAREARRKAEQDALELERVRAEEEARQLEAQEARRRSAEKRVSAAGIAGGTRGSGGDPGYRSSGGSAAPQPGAGQRISDNSQRSERERRSGGEATTGKALDASIEGRGTGGRAIGGGEAASSVRPRVPSASQAQTRAARSASASAANQAAAGAATAGAAAEASQPPNEGAAAARRATQSSFPHAFERWETLSAHWEGLTSFWIRRLQENSTEIQSNPLSQQLSRQVTDLSAAGANLFHAVVELQRLRASSERKFQRWFFETRNEQERAQEVQAMLEATLQEERRGRAEAIADAVTKESERSNSDKLVAEMRRELQISKEEARRAWEELGRREQEERERTASLREGHPTLVGGVQVVPMMQGVPSRHAHPSRDSRPQTREGPYPGGPGPGMMGGQAEVVEDPEPAYQRGRGNDDDPFVEPARATSSAQASSASRQPPISASSVGQNNSSAPAVQPTTSNQLYQQRLGTSLHPTAEYEPGSEAAYGGEYEMDPQGHFRRDSQRRKIRDSGDTFADDESYNTGMERSQEAAHQQPYGGAPATSGVEYVPGMTNTTAEGSHSEPSADYSGQGYGSGPGWEAIPRHHHPTRLSDVLEEDERSRTSASQMSRRD